MVLKTHVELYVRERIFRKNILAPKIGKMNQNGPKAVFFEFIDFFIIKSFLLFNSFIIKIRLLNFT